MEFEFSIDRKCTLWVRDYHHINAETYEQARELMIKNFRESATENTFYGQSFQNDTLEDMDLRQNYEYPTAHLMNHEGDEIADNTI